MAIEIQCDYNLSIEPGVPSRRYLRRKHVSDKSFNYSPLTDLVINVMNNDKVININSFIPDDKKIPRREINIKSKYTIFLVADTLEGEIMRDNFKDNIESISQGGISLCINGFTASLVFVDVDEYKIDKSEVCEDGIIWFYSLNDLLEDSDKVGMIYKLSINKPISLEIDKKFEDLELDNEKFMYYTKNPTNSITLIDNKTHLSDAGTKLYNVCMFEKAQQFNYGILYYLMESILTKIV